jgi:hypothetical protein
MIAPRRTSARPLLIAAQVCLLLLLLNGKVVNAADAAASPATAPAVVLERVEQDPKLIQFREVLETLDLRLQEARATYGENHPAIQQLKLLRAMYQSKYDQMKAALTAQLTAAAAAPEANPGGAATAPPSSSPAATTAAAPAAPLIDTDPQGNATINAQLTRRLPELHFNANAFSDVIDFMRDVTGLNIWVDWAALESAGIGKNVPVTLRVRDVTVASALDLLLQTVGGNTELAYTVEGGVLRITTAERARGRRVVRTYDVGQLAENDPQIEALLKLIVDSVDPASWKDNGGDIGSISQFKSKLIITTTPLNHQKIVALMQSLTSPAEVMTPATPAAAATAPGATVTVHGATVPADLRKEAAKLWEDNYAPRLITVNGQTVNQREIEEEFRRDVQERWKRP